MPLLRKNLARASHEQRPAPRRPSGRTAFASSRAATPADVRQRGQAAQRSAAEVQAVELHLPGCVRERQRGDQRPQHACSCRSAARRRWRRGPPAPDRSTTSGSRRCSNGRSTMPTGTRQPPRPRQSTGASARAPVDRHGGSNWSSVGGTSSGGSHIWWAGGPVPRSWSTTTRACVSALAAGAAASGSGRACPGTPRRGRTRSKRDRTARPPAAPAPGVGAGPAPAIGPETYAARNLVMLLGVRLQVAAARLRRQLVAHRARPARRATPPRRTCAGRSGTTGALSRPRSLPSSRRWLASSRCTPSDRPSRPIMTNRSMNSGRAASSSENSSTTTNRRGHRRQRCAGCSRALP